jgi:hypothetical protein
MQLHVTFLSCADVPSILHLMVISLHELRKGSLSRSPRNSKSSYSYHPRATIQIMQAKSMCSTSSMHETDNTF